MSSGKSASAIAKDRKWPSSSVRQRVAALKRGDPSPRDVGGDEKRLTPELLNEIREFIEEEHGRVRVRVSYRFTFSPTSSRKALRFLRLRPLVIRTVLLLQDCHIRDRRKFAEETRHIFKHVPGKTETTQQIAPHSVYAMRKKRTHCHVGPIVSHFP